jgi:hypothetical protein
MKKAHLTWLFAMTLSMAGNSVAQRPVELAPPWYTFAISADPSTVKAGEKVVIQIAVTNTSDKSRGLGPANAEGFMVDVTVVGNGAAPDTELGRKWKHKHGAMAGTWGGPIRGVEPGETTKRALVISDLYDMTRPGQYTVQVSRPPLKSNTITITVVP